MNRLPSEKRAEILKLMAEGASINSIVQRSSISKNTIVKFIGNAGNAVAEYQTCMLTDIPHKQIQADKIWTFHHAQQKTVSAAHTASEETSDIWTWVSVDANTKLVFSWHLGRQDANSALNFISALNKKIENHTHAMALYFMHYNFVHIHQTLQVTPAMAAGVTDRPWDYIDVVKVVEKWEDKQKNKADK